MSSINSRCCEALVIMIVRSVDEKYSTSLEVGGATLIAIRRSSPEGVVTTLVGRDYLCVPKTFDAEYRIAYIAARFVHLADRKNRS